VEQQMDEVKAKFERELEQQTAMVKKPNLMVIGGTGVGKSSLINSIFGTELAAVGTGAPVTKGCICYEKEGIPLVIFDTEGYEISSNGTELANFAKIVIPEISRRKKLELDQQIHLIWYCISVGNHRITDYDLQNLSDIADSLDIPVAVILTQCDTEEEDENGKGKTSQAFRAILRQQKKSFPVFETSIQKDLPLDREVLMQWSAEALTDDQLRRSFISAQRASLSLKRSEANKVVTIAAVSTGASAGLNPLPISDALLIVPQQLFMARALARVYGFDVLSSGAMALIESQLVSMAGRQLAVSLLKLLPGVGQVVNAAVAAGMTGIMGMALVEAFHRAYLQFLDTGKMPDWAQLLSNENFRALLDMAKNAWMEKQK